MKLAAAAAVLVLGLAACGSGASTSASSSSSSTGATSSASSSATASAGPLTIKDFTFSPQPLTVKAGTAIQIVNDDSQPHTVTSDTTGVFDSGSIKAGGSPDAPVVVSTPGTYAFHCSFHPFMHGQIVVT